MFFYISTGSWRKILTTIQSRSAWILIGLALWIRIRIQIKSWIRILNETKCGSSTLFKTKQKIFGKIFHTQKFGMHKKSMIFGFKTKFSEYKRKARKKLFCCPPTSASDSSMARWRSSPASPPTLGFSSVRSTTGRGGGGEGWGGAAAVMRRAGVAGLGGMSSSLTVSRRASAISLLLPDPEWWKN